MAKTVLVAGAGGFVGSHTLEALDAMEGVKPVALLRSRAKLAPGFSGEVRLGDLRDGHFVRKALEDVDAVCMCAAWTSAWGHAEESKAHLLRPTLDFLDAAVAQGVARVVYPSSTSARVLRSLASSGRIASEDSIWPHMANVNRIEDHMRARAAKGTNMVAMRLGLFVGERYGLGMLPILLPRLGSHLVPWVGKGRTSMPLIAGGDIGRAMALAATAEGLRGFTAMDAVGGEIPTVREVFHFLHRAYGYPLPHFGVSFPLAYAFAQAMEALSRLTPWDPFIARSVVLLLEETAAGNHDARRLLGYEPRIPWQDAIRAQLAEMQRDRVRGLRMVRAIPAPLPNAPA